MCLAVPGRVESIEGSGLAAAGKVSFAGVRREVSLACVPEVKVGDYVMVHVGLALSIVDPDEAQRVFRILDEMGLLAPELGP